MNERGVEQTAKDQHNSIFPIDNKTVLAINEAAIESSRQPEISTILNFPMTIRQLTSYEWEIKMAEQIATYQHHSQFHNINQTTYSLQVWGQQSEADKHRSASFWTLWWQCNHILATNRRATGWHRQVKMSTIHSPMNIRPLTLYKWESIRTEELKIILNFPMTIRSLTSY